MDSVDYILQGVKVLLDHYTKTAPFDRTVRGRVISNAGGGKYVVELYGVRYTIPAYGSSTYTAGEQVWIVIPSNNFNEKFLLPK